MPVKPGLETKYWVRFYSMIIIVKCFQMKELKEQLETESQKVERHHNSLFLSNTLTEVRLY